LVAVSPPQLVADIPAESSSSIPPVSASYWPFALDEHTKSLEPSGELPLTPVADIVVAHPENHLPASRGMCGFVGIFDKMHHFVELGNLG
jgi:hypothetical protein